MSDGTDTATTDETVQVNEVEDNNGEVLFLRNITSQTTTSTVGTTFANDTEEYVESSQTLGENSLFVRYDFLEDENEVFNTMSDEPSEYITDLFDTPISINEAKGSDYNLQSLTNIINLAEEKLTVEELVNFTLNLPNQIRALFLYQLSFVKKLRGKATGDLLQNIKTQSVMNINYFKLIKVEIFDGYEKNELGEDMINKPKFKLLKKSDLDSLTTNTLCRFSRFYSNELKIKRDILSFPLQHQYFFIRPDVYTPEPEITLDTDQEKMKNLSIQHYISKDYNLRGTTSNIVLQKEGVSYTAPDENLTVPNENVVAGGGSMGGGSTAGGGSMGGGSTAGGGSMGGGSTAGGGY